MENGLVYSKTGIYYLNSLKTGEELLIETLDGKIFKGIYYDFKEGYIYTILKFGIFMVFPTKSLQEVSRA